MRNYAGAARAGGAAAAAAAKKEKQKAALERLRRTKGGQQGRELQILVRT